jgi:hypothetical protein
LRKKGVSSPKKPKKENKPQKNEGEIEKVSAKTW